MYTGLREGTRQGKSEAAENDCLNSLGPLGPARKFYLFINFCFIVYKKINHLYRTFAKHRKNSKEKETNYHQQIPYPSLTCIYISICVCWTYYKVTHNVLCSILLSVGKIVNCLLVNGLWQR